ncbi:matrixin family metalloprotease [Geodermatophilus sp. SYSU D00758]
MSTTSTTTEPGTADLRAAAASPTPGRRPPSGPRLLLAAVLALGALAAGLPQPGPAAAGFAPTAGVEVARAPLGEPGRVPARSGPFGFVAVQDDGVTPVAYDPCRPVRYVIRPDHAPRRGTAVVRTAFARLSEATGLRFVYDGPTDEAPGDGREAFQPGRYGDRWAPVLVAWQTEEENPDFATRTIGQAGSTWVRTSGGREVFVTGRVSFDAAAMADVLADPEQGFDAAQGVVLHELGHLVGLGHVPDEAQLMHPMRTEVRDFAAGDLAGLARLGQGECAPDL